MNRPRSAVVSWVLFVAAGCAPPVVLRSAGGELLLGRFIAPQAYEAYARGALAEAEGRLPFAAAAYHRAAQIDPDGPEAWTRLGAVLCKQEQADAAEEAFNRAENADPGYAPLRRERGRCLLSTGQTSAALAEADKALVLDPDDEETTLLRADVLEKSGDAAQAVRELFARLVAGPKRKRLAKRLLELAEATRDEAAAHLARGILAELDAPKPGTHRALLDAALTKGDLATARRLGAEAGVAPGAIALRAAVLGQNGLAVDQARLVLGASPNDTDALVALVAASPPELAPPLPRAATGLSRMGRLVLADTLARRIGPEAAAAAVDAAELDAKAADPLEARLVERLRTAKR